MMTLEGMALFLIGSLLALGVAVLVSEAEK